MHKYKIFTYLKYFISPSLEAVNVIVCNSPSKNLLPFPVWAIKLNKEIPVVSDLIISFIEALVILVIGWLIFSKVEKKFVEEL